MSLTLYRLAEECLKIVNAGNIQVASNVSFGEMKLSVAQVINSLLKTDYLTLNQKLGEAIPNGGVLGLYENIAVTSMGGGKAKATLPAKPLKLPRNMGVFGVYPKYQSDGGVDYDNELIPVQMGQSALLRSQPLLNDLLGQARYENFGMEIIITPDLALAWPGITLSMRLAIMDATQYDDFEILPVPPEMEWTVKQEVVRLYLGEGIVDKVVDATNKGNQNLPTQNQKQA